MPVLFEPVIGLEVHAHLNTDTKIFCSCSTKFGAASNTQVCPVCMGFPGTLPVLNEAAADKAILAGMALGCSIQKFSIFDRKHYFYPDLPKAYQITQMFYPICLGGKLEIVTEEGNKITINITRIHMEEDAGKMIHGVSETGEEASFVDLNRASVPLIEIVSEPEIRSAEEARLYMQKIRTILRYVNVSDCNMEEGSLRCDANVSVRPKGQKQFGTRVEIKNMNSFRNVQRAVQYEIDRQTKVLEGGGIVKQETRLWDNDKGITAPMRSKENAHDYRYFPDPDLFPLIITDEKIETLRKSMPELPDPKKERFLNDFALSLADAELLVSDIDYANFFEETLKIHNSPKLVANWFMSELLRVVNEKSTGVYNAGIAPSSLGSLVALVEKGLISGKQGKEVFAEAAATGKNPEDIVKEKGLSQITDENALLKVIEEIVAQNPKEVDKYKKGNNNVLGFFVGQVMKATKGKANPKLTNDILTRLLQ